MLVLLDKAKIVRFLYDRAITVAEMARLAGVSYTTVSYALTGKGVQIPSAVKIAKALGVPPQDVIADEELKKMLEGLANADR